VYNEQKSKQQPATSLWVLDKSNLGLFLRNSFSLKADKRSCADVNQQSCIKISALAKTSVEGVLTSASSVEQGCEAAESLI